jgi:hypothetical protein
VLKVSFFQGEDESGLHAIPLFGPADSVFEKTAAPLLLPEVAQYIETLHPRKDAQYVLVNAMGAGEYWGSNINGDDFPEASLIHKPDSWTNNPVLDKIKSKNWAYGFPTFYNAHPFAHHRNKDPLQAFGEVELATWHDHMKRVELVLRVDEERCQKFGGMAVWDKLRAGMFPDVSMGCFTAGAQVSLADGTRSDIERISVGDLVLTHRGRARKVTAVHRRMYRGDLYSIKAEAHRTVRCTRQHPFYGVPEVQVKKKDDHANQRWSVEGGILPEWLHASCLDLDYYLLSPVPDEERPLPLQLDAQAARAFVRLLGYYLAEGHLLRNKRREICGIELTTHVDDAVHAEIDELCTLFGTKNPPATHARENSENALGICIFDKRLAELCLEHAGAYSTEKRLSCSAMHWARDLQFELLGAYANGDGCGTEDGSLKFSTSSQQLSWQVQLLLLRSGAIASVSVLHHAATGFSSKPTTEYVVHVGKQHSQRFRQVCAKVRPAEVIKEKNSRVFASDRVTDDKFVVVPVRSLDAIYAEIEVFNLEVAEDESYLVEGLAVHNCRVPYDTCSICLDWDTYRKAQATFVPGKDSSPGDAVLRWHKSKAIRGVSITRKDYCEHARKSMNRILPDGRKVKVYNDYPRFFDISFVFIGADRTAKTMMKIAGEGRVWSLPGAELAEKLGCVDEELTEAFASAGEEKTAAVMGEDQKCLSRVMGVLKKNPELTVKVGPPDREHDTRHFWAEDSRGQVIDPTRSDYKHYDKGKTFNLSKNEEFLHSLEKKAEADNALKIAFLGKSAKDKDAEIVKDVMPSQFAGKAVPLLTKNEDDLPKEVLDMLGAAPLEQSLSTPSALGMVLRPREFQRIMLIQVGKRPLADELDEKNEVFPKVEEELPVPMGPDSFSSILARILGPLMMARSALGPHIEKRVVVMSASPKEKTGSASSHPSELLRKIGAAYNSYRSGLMELVAHAQDLVASMASPSESQFHKLAEATPDSIFTPLSAAYLKQAFWDEVGTTAVVERGSPSRNIAAICSKTAEGS